MKLPTALICDAIKIAYRQSKDGFVVSFAIHPQDMPADLANADIGSQWQMRLVGLDEDGNPKGGDAHTAGPVPNNEPRPEVHKTPPASADPSPKPVRAPIAPDKRLTQRAGILCNDKLFQAWLKETNAAWKIMNWQGVTDEERAVQIVHVYCGVKTRKDIVPGTQAARLFDEMLGKYAAWQACLEEVL